MDVILNHSVQYILYIQNNEKKIFLYNTNL